MIRLEKLSLKHADGAKPVLDNVSTEFRKGRISVILGASGTGKSTLMNCIMQVANPDSGRILLDGKPLNPQKNDPTQISGILQATALFQHMSVLENLTLAPRLVLKKTPTEANREALDLLNRLGILDKAYSFPHRLSGGEAQRAGLARALMMQPKVLVLDEPTSALNDEWADELAKLLKTLKAQGMTIILSTHHLAFAEKVADDLFLLKDGRLKALEQVPDTPLFARPAPGLLNYAELNDLAASMGIGASRRYIRLYR